MEKVIKSEAGLGVLFYAKTVECGQPANLKLTVPAIIVGFR